jgi:hypothetical protein
MILVAALLAAAQADYPVRGGTGRTCGAARLHVLIGRRRNAATANLAIHLSGAGIVRWIRPGQMVTMDYRPDRLDLSLDRNGRIVRATCG